MKYEITKGSAEDFDGAPDEALFVLQCFSTIDYSVDMKATIDGQSLTPDDSQYIIAERRPIEEYAWAGEGLPPAGVECEYELYAGEWRKCRIEFVGRELMIVSTGDSEFSCNFYAKFRPIRSPEDVARDEAIEAMRDAGYTLPAAIRFSKEEMAEIYDAIAAGKIKGVVLESKVADLKINITTDEMWREFEKKSDMDDVRKLMMDSLAEQRVAFNKSRHSSF